MKPTYSMEAINFVRRLASDSLSVGAQNEGLDPHEEAYDIWRQYEAPTDCARCKGTGDDPVYGACQHCSGTGTDVDEDRFLLGGGPVFHSHADTGVNVVGIRLTGRDSGYLPYQQAAARLVQKGLVYKQAPGGDPNDWYGLTEKGELARWALLEAATNLQKAVDTEEPKL